jgi:hypothetical protein
MAYMQKPGRGNHPKTGHGIPTPFRQEIELTGKYEKGKEKLKSEREKGNTPPGLTIDSKTAVATANLPMHTTRKDGSYLKELDSKGNFVKQVNVDANPSLAANFQREVDQRNSLTTRSQTKNSDQYNATGGGISPDKLSAGQKETLVGLGKAKIVKK